MADNGDFFPARTDPFGQGQTAYRKARGRDSCPFPIAYFEGRQWLAGWDSASVGGAGRHADAKSRERPWSHGDVVVLTTLATSGESLGGLASRLGRNRAAVERQCAAQGLVLSAEQLKS